MNKASNGKKNDFAYIQQASDMARGTGARFGF